MWKMDPYLEPLQIHSVKFLQTKIHTIRLELYIWYSGKNKTNKVLLEITIFFLLGFARENNICEKLFYD